MTDSVTTMKRYRFMSGNMWCVQVSMLIWRDWSKKENVLRVITEHWLTAGGIPSQEDPQFTSWSMCVSPRQLVFRPASSYDQKVLETHSDILSPLCLCEKTYICHCDFNVESIFWHEVWFQFSAGFKGQWPSLHPTSQPSNFSFFLTLQSKWEYDWNLCSVTLN